MSRSSKYRIAAVAASATILAFFAFQIVHRARYGHFVGYGVHIDVERGDSDVGRGDMMYANIANLSLRTSSSKARSFLTTSLSSGSCFTAGPFKGGMNEYNAGVLGTLEVARDDAATPCEFTGAIAVGTRKVRPLRSALHIGWVYKDWGENGDLLRIVIRQSRDPNARVFPSAAFRSHFAE